MQETHTSPASERIWRQEFRGQIFFSHGTTRKHGVAILIPQNVPTSIDEVITDDDGQILILDMTINSQNFVLCNYYAPTQDHPLEQLDKLSEIQNLLTKYPDQKIVFGGDFNACLYPDIDKHGGRKDKQSEYAKSIFNLMETFQLHDIWRIRNPEARRYTRRQNTKAGMVHSRIDFFLTSIQLDYVISESNIAGGLFSDHSIIDIIIRDVNASPRGKNLWKMNTSLLKDPEYVSKIHATIEHSQIKHGVVTDKGLLWELVKSDIRSATISYSAYISKQRRKTETELKERLDTLELLISIDNEAIDEYTLVKSETEKLLQLKTQGSLIRSRAKYIEEGEKNTKYFLSLEKRNHSIKHIKSLFDQNDNLLEDPGEILNAQKQFYMELYTEQITEQDQDQDLQDEFLKQPNLSRLNEEGKMLCEEDLSLNEIAQALKEMPNNKTPGSDSLPAEIYKLFWGSIKELVLDSYNYAFSHGRLSIEQDRGSFR